MSYFNTTNESGTTLKNNVFKAKSQEAEIYRQFCYNKKAFDSNLITCLGFSASDILQFMACPITSIRRALTNLTKQGKLIKTNEKRIGMYGRSEYVWKLNENN